MKENIIRNKSFNFAISIIHLYKFLIEKREFVISKQLLKSRTSIGANVEEANALKKNSFQKCQSHQRKPERQGIGFYYFKKLN